MKTDKSIPRKDLRLTCKQIIAVMQEENRHEMTISELVKDLNRPYSRIHNAIVYLIESDVISTRNQGHIDTKTRTGRPTKIYRLNKNKIPKWCENEDPDPRERKLHQRIIKSISGYTKYLDLTVKNVEKEKKIDPKNFARFYNKEEGFENRIKTFGIEVLPEGDPEKFTLRQLEFAISEVFQNKKNPRRFIILPIPLQKGLENYQNAQMIEQCRGLFNSIINNVGKTKNMKPQQAQLEEELESSLEFISKEEKESILNHR